MTVRTYKSTDASAPVLSGQVGSLVALLDACLVNGYGAKSGAGWTKPFTGTNRAAFRNSASTGTGFYCDVNDAAPTVANEAQLRGYEVMSAVGTGTNLFPTTAQVSTGIIVRKSTSADSVARAWTILADDTVFYLFVECGDGQYSTPTRTTAFGFGDFYSYKTSDAYRCMINGRINENSGYSTYENFPILGVQSNMQVSAQTTPGHYIARGVLGSGGAITFGIHADAISGASNTQYQNSLMGQSSYGGLTSHFGLNYPNAADNGLYMSPAYIHHDGGMRGYLKGLWVPCHDLPLGHGDTFAGTGTMSSKAFLTMQMAANPNGNGYLTGECFLETSDTWS